MSTTIFTDGILHCLVFLDGGFCKLKSEFEGFSNITIGFFYQPGNILLAKRFCLHAIIREPLFHLDDTVGIVKVRDVLHCNHELCF